MAVYVHADATKVAKKGNTKVAWTVNHAKPQVNEIPLRSINRASASDGTDSTVVLIGVRVE